MPKQVVPPGVHVEPFAGEGRCYVCGKGTTAKVTRRWDKYGEPVPFVTGDDGWRCRTHQTSGIFTG